MAKDKQEPKSLRKTAQERRRYPIGVDPRKERRRQRAEERKGIA